MPTDDNRTIVPGLWSDVFAGLLTQGTARVKVQLFDDDGEPISESVVVDPLNAIELVLSTSIEQRLDTIITELKKVTTILQEVSNLEVTNDDVT